MIIPKNRLISGIVRFPHQQGFVNETPDGRDSSNGDWRPWHSLSRGYPLLLCCNGSWGGGIRCRGVSPYALLLIRMSDAGGREGGRRRGLDTWENGAPAAGAPWSDCRITSGAC